MGDLGAGMVALSVALTLIGTAVATAWAQKVIGGAAIGVMAEKPELFGRGLVLMVIPETIILFGFVIGFLLLGLIPEVAAAVP